MKLLIKIQYWCLTGFCWLMGLLPNWLLYRVLQDLIYFVFYKIVRYRVSVVRTNLEYSFPDKTFAERLNIERKFYRHLSEVVVDTVDLVSISAKDMKRRIVFEGIEEHERQMNGRNWIAALAHYGSWEYFSAYQFYTSSRVLGVYRPLHSKAFDMFYSYMRSRFGLKPLPMQDVLRYVVSHKDDVERNFALGMIADQTPAGRETFHIFDFLNQKTSFFMGVEKIALKFNLPVYFMHVKKIGRIRYKAHFELIYDGYEKVTDGQITERYVNSLEKMICDAPSLWMWSHKRWKHTRGMDIPENKLKKG